MTKREKRLQRIRQNPKNVSLDDLSIVLGDFGFRLERTVGSHHHFSYLLGGKRKIFTVPFRRPLKKKYVDDALDLIDKIRNERGEDDSDESDTE